MNESINTDLIQRIREIWESSHQQAILSVRSAHLCANWLIGKQIIQTAQGGKRRVE